MQVIIFSSPQRDLKPLLQELNLLDVVIIDEPETFGKRNFWKRWEQARKVCLASKHDNYLILHDDLVDIDLKSIKQIFEKFKGVPFTCSVISAVRAGCWDNVEDQSKDLDVSRYQLQHCDYFDCEGLTNRATLSKVVVDRVPYTWFKTRASSGVGYQLTTKFRLNNVPMYKTTPSLSYHGDQESVMHPKERLKNPLVSEKRLKVVVNIATFAGREKYLAEAIKSLKNQCDYLNVYDNAVERMDLTDNGKFFFLNRYKEPVYYFTCDDDIEYPETYVADMIRAIEKHKTIVTHHGRILKKGATSYYRGAHKAFRCFSANHYEGLIDVAGTGVTAFRTDYFNPITLWVSRHKKMSDLIFALEAKKHFKKITILAHEKGYIKYLDVPIEDTIFGQHKHDEVAQVLIMNQIMEFI